MTHWLEAVVFFPIRGPLWRRLACAVVIGLAGFWVYLRILGCAR